VVRKRGESSEKEKGKSFRGDKGIERRKKLTKQKPGRMGDGGEKERGMSGPEKARKNSNDLIKGGSS